MSMPMIAVTGASRIFCWLPGLMQASSLSRASALRTKTKRAGQLLAEVGPHFSRS